MNQIVAVDENWAIGRDGDLLVSIPEDMKFFRSTTKGCVVIMGRKTLESFPGGRPLKGRVNVVLSRSMEPGETEIDEKTRLVVLPDVDALRAWLAEYEKDFANAAVSSEGAGRGEVYVIGGGSVYRELLPYCEKALVTYVRHAFADADTWYPNLDADPAWTLTAESEVFAWTPEAERADDEAERAGEKTGEETAPEPALAYSFRTYERNDSICC